MGIFTDFATSSGGALLQGVLDEADNIARQDAQTNVTVAANALEKENEAFKKTELAFKHKDELVKTIVANAEEFGIVPGELTVDQIGEKSVAVITQIGFNDWLSTATEKQKNKLFKWHKKGVKYGWTISQLRFDESCVSKSTTMAYDEKAAIEAEKSVREFIASTLLK